MSLYLKPEKYCKKLSPKKKVKLCSKYINYGYYSFNYLSSNIFTLLPFFFQRKRFIVSEIYDKKNKSIKKG